MILGSDPDGRPVRVVAIGGRILPGMCVDTPAGPVNRALVLHLSKMDQSVSRQNATNADDVADLVRWAGGFDKFLLPYRDYLQAFGHERKLHDLYAAARQVPLLEASRFGWPVEEVRELKRDFIGWSQELAKDLGLTATEVGHHLDETELLLSLTDELGLSSAASQSRDRDEGFDLDR